MSEEKAKEETRIETNNKCLFKCESITDAYEYKKMAKYFPKRMYWVFVTRGFFINIVLTALITIISKSWLISLIIFIGFQIFILIFYRVRLEYFAEKIFNNREKRGEINTNYETEFYEDYFIRKAEKFSLTINYSEISRCVENDTNFYLEYPLRNMVVILQKNKCDLELINFIRNKFKNLENKLGDSPSFKEIKKLRHPNLIKTLMIILFIATICCLWGALISIALITTTIQEPQTNFVKYTWVFWCWLPIPLLSIILGFKFNKANLKCTKNIVAGFIIGFLLLIYGSFYLLPTSPIDYDKTTNQYNILFEAADNYEVSTIKHSRLDKHLEIYN